MSKTTTANWPAFILVVFLIAILAAIINAIPEPPAPPDQPCPAPIEYRPTPPVIPTPEPEPPTPKPRDIATEATNNLLEEWNDWRHGPAPRTAEIQSIYEELLRRGFIRRNGEPVSESSGGRRGRRR